MVVVVTGANGQLGQALQSIAENYPSIDFVFCSSSELDITSVNSCAQLFAKYKPAFCINAAAYTAVDKAENETEITHLVNVIGPKNLAEVSKEYNTILIHISTDFVFDGVLASANQSNGYKETASPNPQGVYGKTKLEGEKVIQALWEKHYIVRTSWVYSQFGANFMKTMLRLAKERDELSVVNDQIGTPTNAVDLAETLVTMILVTNQNPNSNYYGIYNFSNEGQCSWYEFAVEIFKQHQLPVIVNPIPSSAYPTPAKRPAYSVLDKSKIKSVFGISISNWYVHIKK